MENVRENVSLGDVGILETAVQLADRVEANEQRLTVAHAFEGLECV